MEGFAETACLAVVLLIMIKFITTKVTYLQYYAKIAFLLFASVLIMSLLSFIFLLRPKDVRNMKHAYPTMKWLPKIVGIDIEIRGTDHIIKEKAAVVVCNHQHIFDSFFPVMLSQRSDSFACIVKKSLLYLWPLGSFLWQCGSVFIDRRHPVAAIKSLEELKRHLKKNPACQFLLFPEGTRNTNVNRTRTLLPFKKGAFHMAISWQLPISPVVYSPYYFIDGAKCHFSQGTVIAETLAPVETTGMTEDDVEQLKNKVQQIMQNKYEQLWKELEALHLIGKENN